ncbi:uncharacterized protein LOC125580346 [Brassica napus]|uniref:uncharacterized protein LOC125580346 n=1 Tax=Brassica napus TaxID=3708 RepID=UPI002078A60F|nr:uncharacterized protein LOC125580346 [Brassica napus]XP_048600659.1 uncharacterized protein LOC125580346 [Brassica napus]
MESFWQLGDELRGQTQSRASEDHKWSTVATKLAEQTRMKGERFNNLDLSKAGGYSDKFSFQDNNNNMLNLGGKYGKASMQSNVYNMKVNKYNGNVVANKELSNNSNDNNAVDKRFKTLPASETLPRNEVLGRYIFVCNNDTMEEDLKRHLFGLPPRYRDSVRAITPGLPLFLYNYTTHQLHGIFEATTFGGTNIDATAWEDKKCKGESRFPAQVRIRVRKICKALEEDSFRPVLHHYDGPKFRLELSVPEIHHSGERERERERDSVPISLTRFLLRCLIITSGGFRENEELKDFLAMESFWQLGDELRGQTQSRASEDHKWSTVATKLAEQTRMKGERFNNLDLSKAGGYSDKFSFQDNNNMLNLGGKYGKASMQSNVYNMKVNKYNGNVVANKELSNNSNDNNAVDKRFKTLPASETLPRNEVLGGYIFVCNNDTMEEDLKRHLFGLPPRYRDSVRAITPGLPLFLYNYTTHQLHGIFEATTFGGTNIDAMAWEDKKCKGESRFPAQVRIRVRKICKALEEDSFRPVLHHYDGPKFRLELSVPETLDLLDLCEQAGSP